LALEFLSHPFWVFALADKLETHYRKAMTCIEKFPQAILAKAFRGELVP
jgi:hypothetical protein